MSTLTGYDASRIAPVQFTGNPEDWTRWKRRFLIQMAELNLSDALTTDVSEDKSAKAYRVLFLSCGEQAADILDSRCPNPNAKQAWDTLRSFYETSDESSIAKLHQQFHGCVAPDDPNEMIRYINTLIDT